MAKKGFTLLETLLVMLIMSAFLLLPILSLDDWQQQIEEKMFFQRFERLLTATQQAAITQGVNTKVRTDAGVMEFLTKNVEKNTLSVKNYLAIPESIQPIRIPDKTGMTFKANSGNYTAMDYISFTFTDDRQEVIRYQFQLGSGKYVKKIM